MRRTFLVSGIILIVGLGGCSDNSNPSSSGQGDEASEDIVSKIIFTSDRDGDYEIFGMLLDGTMQQQLTSNTASDISPDPCSDGSKIAFHSDRYTEPALFTMDTDGSAAVQISTLHALSPRWSSDGDRVTFAALNSVTGCAEIYKIDSNGKNEYQLTSAGTSGIFDLFPSFSPDGSEIVYSSNRDGDFDIYIMNANGSAQRQLTANEGADEISPVFLPDGQKIVFMSDRDGDEEIFIMKADGTDQRQLTTNESVDDCEPRVVGNNIVFVSDRDGDPEIFIMDFDGSNQRQLTHNSSEDSFGDDLILTDLAEDYGIVTPNPNQNSSLEGIWVSSNGVTNSYNMTCEGEDESGTDLYTDIDYAFDFTETHLTVWLWWKDSDCYSYSEAHSYSRSGNKLTANEIFEGNDNDETGGSETWETTYSLSGDELTITTKYVYSDYDYCDGWETETYVLRRNTGYFPPESWPECSYLQKIAGSNRR